MKKINEVLIVEGKSDKQFLETFLDADFLICNGSAIDGFDYEYLSTIVKTRGAIILTDPDYPGQKIRNEIDSKVPGCKHAFVRKEVSIKHHKVGVAESTKEEVLFALENVVSFDKHINGNLTLNDLLDLNVAGSNSKNIKKIVCEHFHIGVCNTKTMLKRLNMLGITKTELEKCVHDM